MSYGNSISLLVGGLGGREGVVLSYPSKKCEMDRLTNEKKKKEKKGRDSSGAEAAQWGCERKEVVVELTTVGTGERSWWNGNWFSTLAPWEISSNSAFLSPCTTALHCLPQPELCLAQTRPKERAGHQICWGTSFSLTKGGAGGGVPLQSKVIISDSL